MIANRAGRCPKCHLTIRVGDPIRPHLSIAGFAGGKPIWARRGYKHAACPVVDAATGEVTRT